MTGLIIFIAWCVLCTLGVMFIHGATRKETPKQEDEYE